jgi:hypothetical protein
VARDGLFNMVVPISMFLALRVATITVLIALVSILLQPFVTAYLSGSP